MCLYNERVDTHRRAELFASGSSARKPNTSTILRAGGPNNVGACGFTPHTCATHSQARADGFPRQCCAPFGRATLRNGPHSGAQAWLPSMLCGATCTAQATHWRSLKPAGGRQTALTPQCSHQSHHIKLATGGALQHKHHTHRRLPSTSPRASCSSTHPSGICPTPCCTTMHIHARPHEQHAHGNAVHAFTSGSWP